MAISQTLAMPIPDFYHPHSCFFVGFLGSFLEMLLFPTLAHISINKPDVSIYLNPALKGGVLLHLWGYCNISVMATNQR